MIVRSCLAAEQVTRRRFPPVSSGGAAYYKTSSYIVVLVIGLGLPIAMTLSRGCAKLGCASYEVSVVDLLVSGGKTDASIDRAVSRSKRILRRVATRVERAIRTASTRAHCSISAQWSGLDGLRFARALNRAPFGYHGPCLGSRSRLHGSSGGAVSCARHCATTCWTPRRPRCRRLCLCSLRLSQSRNLWLDRTVAR